jgi:hypothetical protein
MMHDLAIVVTAMNEASWLKALLPTIGDHHGPIDFEVVVADVESTDETHSVVERFDFARAVSVINRGFSHANNVAEATTDARYVLFLNADTEIVDGTLSDLVRAMDERPEVGLASVRQLTSTGETYPTMRRFATPGRRLAEALGSERFADGLGQRLLDMRRYEEETACDWMTGAFMLVRREALDSAGRLDERFFFTGEEQDLCMRLHAAGWEIRHLLELTIVHHAGKRGIDVRFAQQRAFAEMQLAAKHFGPLRLRAFRAALALNHGLRLISLSAAQRRANWAALRATLGRVGSPFAEPPVTALPAGQVTRARASSPT